MEIRQPEPLSAEALCWRRDPTRFHFNGTADLEELSEFVGQDRAFLSKRAAQKSFPAEWCYVNNFESPEKPRATVATRERFAFAR